ncbi:cytochrome c/ABC transporter substrate-binding protein [Acidicapsa acidisoli]|uniref:cytochrome c/ABC transporter substrate-binding protein n=1 Tax=Acidicapsa acidisoli TaxID=1615681 RepID=UPI0021E076A3|nr:ABC transporter substrate-binding protein [Acidicapsa acidisoli]
MLRKWAFHILSICLAISLNAQEPLAPQEERGRQIYEHGTSSSGGSITATLAGDTEVNGSILPCANCHGADGKGKPESGIFPSNITWDVLTKPYRITNADGRMRPSYNERLLIRAIAMGIDSGGNTLNEAMPRFQLSQADAADLIAYIRRLGHTPDPGLSAASIRIGVLLPPASIDARLTAMTRQALLDVFNPVSASGGVFGRRIDPVFMELPPDPAQRADAVRSFLSQQQVFAVLADLTGAESEIAPLLRGMKMPTIAIYASFPDIGASQKKYVFYLDDGIGGEVDALVRFASQHFGSAQQDEVIVDSADAVSQETAHRLQTLLQSEGKHPRIVSQIESDNRSVVYWLRTGPGSLQDIDKAGASAVLIPGALLAESFQLRGRSNGETYIALRDEPSSNQFSGLTRWIWERATASASLLTEGLKSAGRDTNREALLAALEDVKDARTALPRPITFGPNRHIGATEIRIMELDPHSHSLVDVTEREGSDKSSR